MDDERKVESDDVRWVILDGESWRVFEHTPALDRRTVPTLVFESNTVIRRVREYPPDWREWNDVALLELSWRK